MIGAGADLLAPVTGGLSVAVLNGLWQGTLIWAITAGTLAAMNRRSAQARYRVACLALVAMLAAFAATFSVALGDTVSSEHQSNSTAAVKVDAVTGRAGPAGLPSATADTPSPLYRWPSIVPGWAPTIGGPALPFDGAWLAIAWLAIAWLAGAAAVSLLSILQFTAVRRLTTAARFDVHDRWRDAFDAVSLDLRLGRLVRLGHSAAVEVPMVVGWLAPIVLVPLSSCIALSREEMQAILAHEIAHIGRHDYFVNILQKVVEAVIFFHPATWWLSHRIRVEREFCCDDLAVNYTSSAVAYARALAELETLRARRREYAMGADGGSLMNRITRLVDAKPQRRHLSIIGGALGALMVALIGTAFIVVGNASAEPGTPGATATQDAPAGAGKPTVESTDAAPPEIVALAHTALGQLVTNGTIDQAQADTIEAAVASGHIDETALVGDGVVTEAQMQAVRDVLIQVKTSFAATYSTGDTTKPVCDQVGTKLAQAVTDGKMTQDEANQVRAKGCIGPDEAQSCDAGAARFDSLVGADKAAKIEVEKASGLCAGGSAAGLTCDEIAAQLDQAAKDGQMTQEEADHKAASCGTGQPDANTCQDLAAQLAEAVQMGKATQEQANQKIAGCTVVTSKEG